MIHYFLPPFLVKMSAHSIGQGPTIIQVFFYKEDQREIGIGIYAEQVSKWQEKLKKSVSRKERFFCAAESIYCLYITVFENNKKAGSDTGQEYRWIITVNLRLY